MVMSMEVTCGVVELVMGNILVETGTRPRITDTHTDTNEDKRAKSLL